MLQLNSKKLRRRFASAAKTYDEAAVLQREVADRLLERLEYIKQVPQVILDVGCGTGYCTRLLAKKYPQAFVAGFDITHPMLIRANNKRRWFRRGPAYVTADAHIIPVKSNSVDLIFSNLVLQWCDQASVFNEFARVLKPGGLVMFSTFGPDTLMELRMAWASVDDNQHVHDFLDMHNIGDDLVHVKLSEPVMDKETIILTYQTVAGMLKDLRQIGANNAVKNRFTGLTGKNRFASFTDAYKKLAVANLIPASYEIIYGQAWGPVNLTGKTGKDFTVPIQSFQQPQRPKHE
ncbi:MAG: malonyl-ACP O-methyltransferase BioC [Acidiferrobacterales bacterium]